MFYDTLLAETGDTLEVKEIPLKYGLKGLYSDGRILIERKMSNAEKACVLAEEIGHHYTSTGNILDQSDVRNRKQELIARIWAYQRLIPLKSLIKANDYGIRNQYELANLLEVTEEFLAEALSYYKAKYGFSTCIDNHIIFFDPLHVIDTRRAHSYEACS